jgi:hypothetical protein
MWSEIIHDHNISPSQSDWCRLLVFILGLIGVAHSQVLIYNFNDALGTTAANSGTGGTTDNLTIKNSAGTATDYLSGNTSLTGDTSGVDGTQTLNLTSASAMGSGTGPYVSSAAAGAVFNGAVSFTIAGWYDASSAIGGGARLLDVANNSDVIVYFPSSTHVTLQVNSFSANSATAGGSGTSPTLNATNQWTFFAITYSFNGTTVTDNFYGGNTTGTSSINDWTVSYTPTGTNGTISGGTSLAFGSGTTGNSNNAFQGSFDNLYVYTSTTDATGALTLSQIDSLYALTIPEPPTVQYIFLAPVFFLCLALLKRKRPCQSLLVNFKGS